VQVQQKAEGRDSVDVTGLSVRELECKRSFCTMPASLLSLYGSETQKQIQASNPDYETRSDGEVDIACWEVTFALFQSVPGEGEWLEFFVQATVRRSYIGCFASNKSLRRPQNAHPRP